MTIMARAAGARLVVVGAALTCLTVLVGGCGTATGSSTASNTSVPAASPANSADPLNPTGTATATAGSGVQTPAPAGTLTAPPAYGLADIGYACPMSAVRVTLGVAQGTKSVTYQVIDFTNRGPKQCSVGGAPGASLAGGSPLAQIGLAAMTANVGLRARITLNPGEVANAVLEIRNASNVSKAACDPVRASYLVIAVPNTLGFYKLAYGTTACAKPIQLLSMGSLALGSGG